MRALLLLSLALLGCIKPAAPDHLPAPRPPAAKPDGGLHGTAHAARHHLLRAMLLAADGDLEEAALALERARFFDPVSHRLDLHYGLWLMDEGRPDRAADYLRRAADGGATAAWPALMEARFAFARDPAMDPAAREVLAAWGAVEDLPPPERLLRGAWRLEMGAPSEAVDDLGAWLVHAPRDAAGLEDLLRAASASGRWGSALARLEEIAAANAAACRPGGR